MNKWMPWMYSQMHCKPVKSSISTMISDLTVKQKGGWGAKKAIVY